MSIEVVFKALKMETMWSGPKTEAQDTSSFGGQEEELEQVDEAEKEQPVRLEGTHVGMLEAKQRMRFREESNGDGDKYISEGCWELVTGFSSMVVTLITLISWFGGMDWKVNGLKCLSLFQLL